MPDGQAVLELRDVDKYFGGLPAVRNVTLDVPQGQIFAIIGPNGAGKSTLLKTISGMLNPTAGRVVFQGHNITGLKPHEIRQQGIAKALQIPRPLPSLTTRENVALGAMFGTPGGRRAQGRALTAADEALELVGLADKADAPVGELNLHEQRTLDLARALAGEPRLLLLDEIMAGLNPSELENSMDVLRQVRAERDVTIIWVEHVMRAVTRLADHVAVLNFGQLLTQGRPEEVMRDDRVIEAYLGKRRGALGVDHEGDGRDGDENGGSDARGQ